MNPKAHAYFCSSSTEWTSALVSSNGITVELVADANIKPGESESFILGAGIEFGNPLTGTIVEPVKYSGSAKILIAG
jgi:hypothetical protein